MRTASNCVRGLREARFGQWHTSASGGQWFLDQVSMIQKKVLAAQQLIGRFRSGPRINAGVMGWFLGLYMASLPNLVLSAIILSMVLVSCLQENSSIKIFPIESPKKCLPGKVSVTNHVFPGRKILPTDTSQRSPKESDVPREWKSQGKGSPKGWEVPREGKSQWKHILFTLVMSICVFS